MLLLAYIIQTRSTMLHIHFSFTLSLSFSRTRVRFSSWQRLFPKTSKKRCPSVLLGLHTRSPFALWRPAMTQQILTSRSPLSALRDWRSTHRQLVISFSSMRSAFHFRTMKPGERTRRETIPPYSGLLAIYSTRRDAICSHSIMVEYTWTETALAYLSGALNRSSLAVLRGSSNASWYHNPSLTQAGGSFLRLR